jgi:hypothetical protein
MAFTHDKALAAPYPFVVCGGKCLDITGVGIVCILQQQQRRRWSVPVRGHAMGVGLVEFVGLGCTATTHAARVRAKKKANELTSK